MIALSTLLWLNACNRGTLANTALPTPTPVDPPIPTASPTPSASPTPTPAPSPTPASTTISEIQQMGGWGDCTASCAGTGTAVYSMTQGITSPALSGDSAQFQLLSGTEPYSGALWFRFMGSFATATHFVYDLSFYVDNPAAAQGLEFGIGQSVNGNRYRFYTQCLLIGGSVWRVWNPSTAAWVASSVACATPAAKTWTHIVWEFERDSSDNVIFTAVTVNGSRSVVNMSMPHDADTSTGVDVSFQADANSNAAPYSVWLDNVTLTFW